MTRRQFLHRSLTALAGAVATACAPSVPSPTATPSPMATPTMSTAPGRGPTPTPIAAGYAPPGALLHNEEIEGFLVRYAHAFYAPDPAAWHLEIKGMVDAPLSLALDDILRELPHKEQNTRLKCVESWSVRAQWGGFPYAALAALVKPQTKATHVYFGCADGYEEILPIGELAREGALFVTHMNGQLLPAKYGAPLRVIVPWLYGYKGAKVITRLEFSDKDGRGYWAWMGAFSTEGIIEAGHDYPLDLGRVRREITGGEITEY